jgi:hypothetical protein
MIRFLIASFGFIVTISQLIGRSKNSGWHHGSPFFIFIFFLKGRGKRLATPIYIRLESKEMEDTKPKNRRGEDKKEKIKGEEQKPTRPDQQDLSY